MNSFCSFLMKRWNKTMKWILNQWIIIFYVFFMRKKKWNEEWSYSIEWGTACWVEMETSQFFMFSVFTEDGLRPRSAVSLATGASSRCRRYAGRSCCFCSTSSWTSGWTDARAARWMKLRPRSYPLLRRVGLHATLICCGTSTDF